MKYKCIECGFIGFDEDYKEAYTYCETCGDHCAFQCPDCGEIYDGVWDNREKIKEELQ